MKRGAARHAKVGLPASDAEFPPPRQKQGAGPTGIHGAGEETASRPCAHICPDASAPSAGPARACSGRAAGARRRATDARLASAEAKRQQRRLRYRVPATEAPRPARAALALSPGAQLRPSRRLSSSMRLNTPASRASSLEPTAPIAFASIRGGTWQASASDDPRERGGLACRRLLLPDEAEAQRPSRASRPLPSIRTTARRWRKSSAPGACVGS